jgi:hypothetical protein
MSGESGQTINLNVQQGDSAWKFVASNLSKEGKKPSNQEIAQEMECLAKLNGCKNSGEFGKKFISGKTISIHTADKQDVKKEVKEQSSATTNAGDSIQIKSAIQPGKSQQISLLKMVKSLPIKR